MDAIEQVLQKYHVLFRGAALSTATPSIVFDWQKPFRMRWIARDDL
jgi:hypothetical protein